MKRVLVGNISEVNLNIIPFERLYNAGGDFFIDERVSRMYKRKGYDAAPKTEAEADERGVKNFNGLMSSFTRPFGKYPTDSGTIVTADIAPTRYLIGQAWRDLKKEGEVGEDELQGISPRMANVSILVPIRYKGRFHLVSQIKGKALGSGEILASPSAGNVDATYLWKCLQPQKYTDADVPKDPLTAALKGEISEEVGMDLRDLDSTSFTLAIDDGAGGINMCSIARNADLTGILHSYEGMTRRKLAGGEKLEVAALSLLKVGGIALVPIEGGRRAANEVVCFYPTSDGLTEKVEDIRTVRPYTEAIFEYLEDMDSFRFFMEKAGLGGDMIMSHLPDDIGA